MELSCSILADEVLLAPLPLPGEGPLELRPEFGELPPLPFVELLGPGGI